MEPSRLPLPTLLGLCGALLMLSPELLLGIAGKILDLPVTGREVQDALTFTVEQHNKDTGDSTNYYKVLHLVKVVKEVDLTAKYHFTVLLVKTICPKKPGMVMTYENFQKCPLFPGNPKELICYFRAFRKTMPVVRMQLAVNSCTPSLSPKELFCSG